MEQKNNIFYTIAKPILKVLFNIYYRPKVEGIENIPSSGPVLLCGNHIHAFDQCIPMMTIKRQVRYMAKKEYFDSKFAWFFKNFGCISVNRSIHDKNAKDEAIETLKQGNIIGLFPEGTRNQVSCKNDISKSLYKYYKDKLSFKKFKKILKNNQVRITEVELLNKLKEEKKITKEEYIKYILLGNRGIKELLNKKIINIDEYQNSLLLEPKYGTVSMALKTDAYILPFIITGKYKFFNNKLKCTFLKPFKIKDNDLEKSNKKLKQVFTKALYNNL